MGSQYRVLPVGQRDINNSSSQLCLGTQGPRLETQAWAYLIAYEPESANSAENLINNNLVQVTEQGRPKRWSGQNLRACYPAGGP